MPTGNVRKLISRRDCLTGLAGWFATGAVALSSRGNEESTRRDLRVMSFNIRYGTASDGENHWSERRARVVHTIQSFDPDLLGLQEVLDFQGDYLKAGLPGYDFHGVGREDGKQRGEFAPLMFRRSRFELLDSGHLWLSETPDVPGSLSWEAAFTRMLSWVRLRDLQSNGREWVFANSHFDHISRQARLESAHLIRMFSAENQGNLPIILTGDFNCTEDDPPYRVLLGTDEDRSPQLIDSYRAAHPERKPDELTFNGWEKRTEGSRIDWILHSPEFKAVSAGINRTSEKGRTPSDHYPVQAVLRYR